MKNFFVKYFSVLSLVLFSFSVQQLHAGLPEWQKIDIGDSGCKAYFPGTLPEAEVTYSHDGSKMYIVDLLTDYWGDFRFVTITVVLKDGTFIGQEEEMLMAYMDFLKGQFGVNASANYGRGHTLSTHPSANGVINFWGCENGDKIRTTGWAAENILTVMMIIGSEEFEHYNIAEMFFKGFRFPGD
jgi:hypothetical protein